jgi:2-iminobutanoate/2-iminopropanoate deaminase
MMQKTALVFTLLFAGCATAPRIVRYTDPARVALNAPYSDSVRAGGLIFVSGKIGTTPGAGVTDETAQALEAVKATLAASGASMNDVVKCTVILADIADWDAMNVVYRKYFPSEKPARTTFGAALVRGARVEIDCIASLPGGAR